MTFVPASGCNQPVLSLQAAAQGSTAISPLQCPFKSYTKYWGPILPSTVGLLLGHSSLSMKGIMVHTGVIGKNYIGQITVMITVLTDWQFKARGKKLWLLFLPYIVLSWNSIIHEGGFGSTYKTASFGTFEGI